MATMCMHNQFYLLGRCSGLIVLPIIIFLALIIILRGKANLFGDV